MFTYIESLKHDHLNIIRRVHKLPQQPPLANCGAMWAYPRHLTFPGNDSLELIRVVRPPPHPPHLLSAPTSLRVCVPSGFIYNWTLMEMHSMETAQSQGRGSLKNRDPIKTCQHRPVTHIAVNNLRDISRIQQFGESKILT